MRRIAWMFAPLFFGWVGSDLAQVPGSTSNVRAERSTGEISAITAPHRSAVLSAAQTGRIAHIFVDPGQRVSTGTLIYSLEDGVQRARVIIAAAEAESTIAVNLARARFEHADREWKRLSALHGDAFASSKEMHDARSEVEIASLELELAGFAREQARRAHERERDLLSQFHGRAPFDAYVVRRFRQPGETVDVGDSILSLAQLDPLEVIAHCPMDWAPRIREGDRFLVRPDYPNWTPRRGTVILYNRVADGGSQTVEVKLLVENNDGEWIAGMKVRVDFLDRDSVTAAHAVDSGGG